MRRACIGLITLLTVAGLIAAVQRIPGNVEPALSHSIGAIQPRVSPDGKTIVMSYQGALWTIARTGGEMTRLTSDAGFDIEPVWSPDGESIAYVNSPRFGGGVLRIISKTGQQIEVTRRIDVVGTPAYYKLEWLGRDRIVGAFRVGGQSMGIGWVNWKTGDSKSLVGSPRWSRYSVSPDERWLIYTTTFDVPNQQMGNDGVSVEVWRVAIDGGEPEKLFRFPSRIHDLCHAADGSGLYVVGELGGGQAHNDLWYVPFREPLLHMRRITFGAADEDRPSVSRDGHWLVYTDNQRGATSVVVRDLTDNADVAIKVDRLNHGASTGQIKINLLDQATKEAITARVSVTQVDGKFTAPPGALYRVLDDAGNFYCESTAEWTVPAGKYRIRVHHGLEYRPDSREVEVTANQSTDVKIEMQRWAELPQRGWYSGENHIHANYGYGQWYSSPRTVLQQSAGEGIGISNIMVANSDTDGIYDREYFRGRPDGLSTDRTIVYWNQEFRSTIWGHMTLVNLKQVVEPIMTGFKETTNPWDVPTNSDIADKAHWQGAHVNYTHVAQNPDDPYQHNYSGKGIPIDVALGKIDSLDLNASYAGTIAVWHRLLNCGFRVPPSAGTDCFLNRISSRLPGADRVYVKIDGPLDYGKWIDGLRAGRSFVTNGPMLELSIGQYQLGQTIKLETARELTVTAKATSHFPMAAVQLIYNGKVIATAPLSESGQQAKLELPVKLDQSGWLALRASGPGHRDHPTPSLEAHTSPIYVDLAGAGYRSKADAEYFLNWIDRLSLAIRVRDRLPDETQRRHVEGQIEAARAVYLKIVETGN